jgi:RNA polymerase sigma factor (sigma-70 family)
VLGYLRSQGADEPDDLTGEIFLQVARDLSTFEGDLDALRRWVFTIAHNRLIDDLRRRARQPRLAGAELPEHAAREQGPPDGMTDPDLLAALAELTDAQREVIVLRFVADLPLEAVARITGRGEGAVKAMQHRALAQLSRKLAVSSRA